MTYITASDRNPFGEDFDETILKDAGRDSAWLDGYSNKRIEREHAIRRGDKAPPLPYRFHLARGKSTDGQRTDGKRMQHWQSRKGYRPVEWNTEAFKTFGIDPTTNPAYSRGEDGLVYNGTQVLMVADGKVAAANFARVQDEQNAQSTAAADRMADAGEKYAASTGGESPTFSEQLDPISGDKIADQPVKRGPGRPRKNK